MLSVWTSTLKLFGIQGQKKDIAIPFALADYLELVDWSGRAVRDDKRGAIEHSLPPILQRLGVDPEEWLKTLQLEGQHSTQAIGRVGAFKEFAETLHRQHQRMALASVTLSQTTLTQLVQRDIKLLKPIHGALLTSDWPSAGLIADDFL